MVSSPRAISRATKSSTASLFGNALPSAVSFPDASLACSGGNRSRTKSSLPIPPGHGSAAEEATASSAQNHETTHPTIETTSVIADTTTSAFFTVPPD